jgi:3'-5' exoribonuclease
MKSPYVKELKADQPVQGTFLVHGKDVRQKKTGEPYISLVLADRTGDIDAKMWDGVSEVLETFERDDFVRVRGAMQIYQNRPQLTIHKLLRVDDAEVDFADFFPASARDPEEMFVEMRGIIRGIGNPHLRALLDALMDDPDIAERYKRAPAAKSIHHAWLGGLIEHVLSLCKLCQVVAPQYPWIDLDLLLAGVILHDIGKIDELHYSRSFNYSDTGQLLGHMIIALRMIAGKMALLPDFPPKLRNLLDHMIISHHGELEFGSPKVPLFPEALLLHHLDNMDSKMDCMRALIDKDTSVEGNFTGWSQSLERPALKKSRYLNEQQQNARPSASAANAPAAQPAARTQGSLFANKLQSALKKES